MNKFKAFPKNPAISKVFRETGYADELGSGMRNTNKYTKLYSGGTPRFVEDNIFQIIIPIDNVANLKVGPTTVMSNITKIPASTIRRYMKKFCELGILVSEGKNKGTQYRLK